MTTSQRFQSRDEAANKGETVMHIVFVAYLIGTCPDMAAVLGYTRKKNKQGKGVEDMEFPEVSKK